jgi:hypothetical protein
MSTKKISKVTDEVDNKVVENVVKDIQETPASPVAEPSASPQQVQVLSNQDTFVSDLVKEQPKTVSELTSISELKMRDILELPEECKKLHKVKYRYRWLAKNKNLEATLRSSIWALCTRDNSPYIKQYRFKSHGAVEQSGMLLAFATEAMGKKREQAPADKSARLVKHYTVDLKKDEQRGFYEPKNAGGDDEEGLEMDQT